VRSTFLSLLLCATVCAHAQLAVNPAVTQATIHTTICEHGWTASVRPSLYYTNKIKRLRLRDIGLPWVAAKRYELDHVIPLTLGGAPRDPANLSLQLWPEARVKDKLEVKLNRLVCSGKMPLSDAQACIHTDWRACATTVKGK
jgi:hypothetical protein